MNMSEQQKAIIMSSIQAGKDGTPDQQVLRDAVLSGESDVGILETLIEQVSPAVGG